MLRIVINKFVGHLPSYVYITTNTQYSECINQFLLLLSDQPRVG